MGNRYTVYKDKHQFYLWGTILEAPSIRKDRKQISWRVRFDANCAYVLPSPDDRDWNKGGGLSFDMLTNHEDSAMWVWRWNAVRGVVELSAYCHIAGARPFLAPTDYAIRYNTDSEVCLQMVPGQTARISLEVDYQKVFPTYDFNFMVEGSGESWGVQVPYPQHKKRWTRTIGPWFGGNRAAPHRMDIFLKRSEG